MKKIKNVSEALTELNLACDVLEKIFGDYEEISKPMSRINAVIDYLAEQEQKKRRKK